MREQGAVVVGQTQHMRGGVQTHEHPLRPVLEKPAARLVMPVVAIDELQDLRIGDGLARAAVGCLALRMQAPAAPRVQRQPAVHRWHIWPAGQGVLHRLVHGQGRMMIVGGVMTMAGATGIMGTATGWGA
ncbi:hypothetical protein D3C71_1766520 [compost metagenome]